MQTEIIRVFDEAFRYIGVCDDYSYLNYKKSFAEAGDLTMRVVFTKENYALYSTCAYLCVPDGGCFAVDAVYSDGETVTVRGRDVLALFDCAVFPRLETLSGAGGAILCSLAAAGASALPLPLRTEGMDVGAAAVYDAIPDSLYVILGEAAAVFGMGMELRYDFESEEFVFAAKAVVDRTAGQTAREPLILGRDRENLAEEYYASDRSDYRNGAVVVGEGADGGLLSVTVPAPAGEPPRYLYRAARAFTAGQFETEETYRAALYRLGEVALASHRPRLTYTAILNPNGEETVAPGDRATVRALSGGELFDAVVVTTETRYDGGNYERRIVAGTILPTASDLFGRKSY